MGFPRMGRQAVRGVTMPELAGGINLRDSVSMVRDNQLTDGLNVWYKDAVLKTRPGMRVNQGVIDGGRITDFMRTQDQAQSLQQSDIVPYCTDIYRMIDGKRYCLFAAKIKKLGVDTLLFQFVADDAVIDLPEYSKDGHIIDNFFVVEQKQTLYCFITLQDSKENKQYITINYDTTSAINAWYEMSDLEYYVPLVMLNCSMGGNYESTFDGASGKFVEGTMLEGYNLLTGRYRVQFNMDTVDMQLAPSYTLPFGIKYGSTVIATTLDNEGIEVKHTVVKDPNVNPSVEAEYQIDGYKLVVYDGRIAFWDANKSPLPDKFKKLKNNLEIEASYENTSAHKVFDMQHSTWFGGKSAGINGGTRLFLCGNTRNEEKNLVVWSDLDNPLYFPENNYFYVGNSSQAVTGFGKQNEILVLFKERELFYTYYQQRSEYSAADVISQNVIDVTAAAAYFPLVQIHGSIGCDCPNSIQLCRNRLVWASTQGKVYTLTTNNQYSERNVYEISGMVERRLEKETMEALAGAFSCDWQGLYCLFVNNHVYLMDYNSYGYQYAYSYSKTEDSNVMIPWWYWELPEVNGAGQLEGIPHFVASFDKKLVIYRMEEDDIVESDGSVSFYQYYHIPYIIDPAAERDLLPLYEEGDLRVRTGEREIPCMLQSKIFDFGQPQYHKMVPLVNIAFGNNGGAAVRVTYITENGEYSDTALTLRHDETSAYAPGYVRNVPLRPCVGFAARFGLRLECAGKMAVDSVALNYRVTGGAK